MSVQNVGWPCVVALKNAFDAAVVSNVVHQMVGKHANIAIITMAGLFIPMTRNKNSRQYKTPLKCEYLTIITSQDD